MKTLLVGLAIAVTLPQGYKWPTLAEEARKLGTDVAGLPVDLLNKQITSFAEVSDNGRYGLAYYVDHGDTTLHAPLFVAIKDRGRPWRQAALTNSGFDPSFGSAMTIKFLPELILVTTHLSPSAGDLLVIRDSDLTLVDTLYGWFQTQLPDGKIVFMGSMVHFAPMHQEELHVYDPKARRQTRFYPPAATSQIRLEFVDRLRPIYAAATAKGAQNNYGGWDPTWFDVSIDDASYAYSDSKDELTFAVTLSGNHPAEVAPRLRQGLDVVCRPMRDPNPTCTESKR